MKLKLGKVFAGRKSTASADIPTVMVSAPLAGDTGMAGAYDPTRAVSVVEQLRAAARGGKAVKQLPLIGHCRRLNSSSIWRLRSERASC